ncbi:MAG: tetratricopeptide repeat protein [Cyanobacteria bacterium J06634_6]
MLLLLVAVFLRLNKSRNQNTQPNELKQAISKAQVTRRVDHYVRLGHLYRASGDLGHALAAYHQALRKDPDNLEALWQTAVIEHNLNNLYQAAKLLHYLINIEPGFHEGKASLVLAQILFSQGDFYAANHHLAKHLRRWSHPEAYQLSAQIKSKQKEFAETYKILHSKISIKQESSLLLSPQIPTIH